MSEASKTPLKTNEVLGVDLGSTSIKLARVRRNGAGGFTLVDADVMPPMTPGPDGKVRPLCPDKKLATTYAACCYSGHDAVIRYMDVSAKMATGKMLESRLRKQLSLGPEYRVSSTIAKEGPPDGDHQVLAVAVPETGIDGIRRLFTADRPSLVSLEVSGLAALHSFEGTAAAKAPGAVCYIDSGAEVSMVSFLVGGRLCLVRKFEYGTQQIVARLQELLDSDEETALGILFGDPQAVEQSGENPMAVFLKQLVTSAQFIEKSENVRVSACHTSGGLSHSPYFNAQIQQFMEAETTVWNPLEQNGIKNYPKGLKGVESMFAGAIGAAMAVLQPR